MDKFQGHVLHLGIPNWEHTQRAIVEQFLCEQINSDNIMLSSDKEMFYHLLVTSITTIHEDQVKMEIAN